MDSFSNLIDKTAKASMPLITVLNTFGGLVGIVWLLIIGQWKLVLGGLFAGVVFSWVYSILLLITYPAMMLVIWASQHNKIIVAGIAAYINMLVTHLIDLAWVVIVFLLATGVETSGSLWPYILFGYVVATGPFAYMASHEADDAIASYVGVWLVDISYIILTVLYFLSALPYALPIVLLVTLIMEIFLMKIGLAAMRLENKNAN